VQPLVIVKDASRSLVGALQTFASILIWIGIYILPVVTILGILVFLMWRLANIAWKTRKSPIS